MRLEEELGVIGRLGLAGFFLLHHEMLELAREVAREVRGPDSVRALLPPGRGRGSSVSSLVCYLTGLSHIDPLANRLALGRFLHEELTGLPDIDLDFPRDIRERLIPRVHDRFGRDRAALVAAFPTFRARGAIRELGKVLGLAPGEIERLARGADHYGSTAEHDIDTALGEGRPRPEGGGQRGRAGGPLGLAGTAGRAGPGSAPPPLPALRRDDHRDPAPDRLLPGRARRHGGPADGALGQGLLRRCGLPEDRPARSGDALGRRALRRADRPRRGERIDLSRIPFDDPETFRAIRAADTVGVFQVESRAQMQSLLRTRPRNLDDLTIQVAIVRPGPIQGGAVNPYIERLQRLREDPGYEIPYDHPALEQVLAETLGTIIFQDQVMQVAEVFAGYTPGEADGLRRAMSRKRSSDLLQGHHERFLEGARRHCGAELQTAERVWGMVVGFAGFGFPKAHSAAFGLLAYQSTWLRVHYGPEFLCALLNEQPMGFYAPDSLVHEAQNRGIGVLGLDVNASDLECTVEPGGVRLGLGYVKDATAAEMEGLLAERRRGGPYGDLGDLAGRSGVRRVTLEQLAWSGACDDLLADGAGLPQDRRSALWQLGLAAPALALEGPHGEHPTRGHRRARSTQLALGLELPAAPALRPLGRWQRLIADYSTSGVTVSDHAMAVLRERLTVPRLTTSAQLTRLPSGCDVALAGLVIARQRPGTAGGTMFLLFEDEFGTVNLIVPRAVYERRRHLARAEPLLLARGRLERTQERGRANISRIGGPAWDRIEREADGEPIPPVVNLIVRELEPLERFLDPDLQESPEQQGTLHRLPAQPPAEQADDPAAAEVLSSMRAVAPPIQSFASGRRR